MTIKALAAAHAINPKLVYAGAVQRGLTARQVVDLNVCMRKMEMTREEMLKEFRVNEYGIIRTPGKFEGEMLYAPYFYEMVMDGFGEDVYAEQPEDMSDEEWEMCDSELLYTELEVTAEDREMFPELDLSTQHVQVAESGRGFVYVAEV